MQQRHSSEDSNLMITQTGEEEEEEHFDLDSRAAKRQDERESFLTFLRNLSGLPSSCRRFFSWSVVVCCTILAHAVVMLAATTALDDVALFQPGGDRDNETIAKSLLFHGSTQLLFGGLGLYFTVFALRRENEVEIMAAIWLVGSVLVFDVSALSNALPFVQDSLGLDDGTCSSPSLLNVASGANGTVPGNASSVPAPAAGNATDPGGGGCKQPLPLPLFVAVLLPSSPNPQVGVPFRTGFFAFLTVLWLRMMYYGCKARVDFGLRIFKL
jgi:hypothetical protein